MERLKRRLYQLRYNQLPVELRGRGRKDGTEGRKTVGFRILQNGTLPCLSSKWKKYSKGNSEIVTIATPTRTTGLGDKAVPRRQGCLNLKGWNATLAESVAGRATWLRPGGDDATSVGLECKASNQRGLFSRFKI